MKRVWLPAAITASALLLAFAAAPPRAAAERFSGETTNVVAVEVPLQVVKDGEPVRGLTVNDFEVSEGRKKLKIVGFDVVDLAAPAAAAPGTVAPAVQPLAARRHFLLLFDLSFSEPHSVLKARQAAEDLVTKSLTPTDLVAVATYSAAQGPQLALGFTADRRQIAEAIRSLGVVKPLERTQTADPLRLVYDSEQARLDNTQLSPQGNRGELAAAREAELLDTLKSLSEATARQDRQNQVNRVVALSRSLADLARMMGNVDGRKYVVYLSEGFDSSLLTGTTDPGEVQQQNTSLEQNPYLTNTENRNGDIKTLNRLEKMFDEFRRADCVIQAVDIGGLRGSGDLGYTRPNGKEALFTMAKETGGELYENWNDLGGAMGKMLQRTSVTYVLTLQPDDLKLDGAYHKLSINLKNAPRGTRVVAKPGFYAPRPFAQRNPLERALDAADSIVGGVEGGTISTAILAAPFRPAAGAAAYVPVVVEVDGASLLANQQGDVAPTEIYAYALDEKGGGVRDFFSQTLGLDLGKVGPQLKSSGLKFFGHLDLPAGDYSLRVLVRNGKTGSYSLRAMPIHVPAFAQAGPFLLPPLFPEAPGRWLMVREAKRATGSQDAPYPFMMGEQPYVPASRPVLGAGQAAQLSLVAYNLGEGEVKAAARVLGVDGKEVQPADLQVTGRERGGSAGPDRLTASLKAPQLQPGEYQLQVTLTGGAGGAQTSSIPFVVPKPGARG
ncbi:MAG TPA: VWA domain-containing protein [Thermoanaerobaculia bacterium]|nr:VWA domain-containing protein [Thermoanaerobaculia bacterium]